MDAEQGDQSIDELKNTHEEVAALLENAQVYQVEKVLDKRIVDDRIEYSKWKGYPDSQNGWEPEDYVYSKHLSYEFERKRELEEKRRLAAVKWSLDGGSTLTPKRLRLGDDVVSGTVIENNSLIQALGLNYGIEENESDTDQKAVYLQKPGDPSKYIFLMGDQFQSKLILNNDGTSSTAFKFESDNDRDIQMLSHTKKQNLYRFMNSTLAKQKKKPLIPRKSQVAQQQIQSQSFMINYSQMNADDPSSSGRRRRSKLPAKFNDYIVENFDEAITSGGIKPEIRKFSESGIDLSGDSNFEESLSAAFEDDIPPDRDQSQSEFILNKDGTFSTAFKLASGNDGDIQMLSYTKKQNLYGFRNSTPAKHKKKPGRPRKSQVPQQQIQSQSFMSNYSQLNADDPSSSGRRRRSKLPSKFNDYIVENFDEAITSGGIKPEIRKFSESKIDLSGDSNFEESLSAAFEDDDDDDIPPDRDQSQSEFILNKDGTFSTAFKLASDNDGDIQMLYHTKKQNLYGFLNSTPAKHKKKSGRPRKSRVAQQQQAQLQQQIQSQSFMINYSQLNADDPSSSGRRRCSKLPSKFNDYIVENFDEAITSGGTLPKIGKFSESEIDLSGDSNFEESLSAAFEDENDDDIIPDGISNKANKSVLKVPRAPTVIPLGGNAPTPGTIPEMRKFPSTKKRGRPRKFEPQRHIIVQTSTRRRGGMQGMKKRPGKPSKEYQSSWLTNRGYLGVSLSELMARKSSIVSRKIKEDGNIKKNRVFVVMQDGTIIEISGNDHQLAVLKATAKVEAISRCIGRIREIEKSLIEDDDENYSRDAVAEKENLLCEIVKFSANVFAEKDTKDDFPELTDEMEIFVEYFRRVDIGNPTEVITKYDDIQLLRKGFRTLNEESWLMDDILNCYLKLLMERSKLDNYPSMYCYNSFFFASLSRNPTSRSIKRWSRTEDIFSYDLLCFPLHLNMEHWTLCVVDNRDKTVKFYDSMTGSHHEHVTVPIRNYLIAEMQNKKGIAMPTDEYTCIGVKNLPQQQNGSDCGMFTLKYAEYITRNSPITFNQEHMTYFRRRMAWELLNHELM